MTKHIQKFIRLVPSSYRLIAPMLCMWWAYLVALTFLTRAIYSHVHIEIEVPHGTWERVRDEENYEAAQRVWDDPDNASDRDKAWAAEWSYEHGA